MNAAWFVILKKELKDMTRDRRALFAILYYAFGIPLIMGFVMFLMTDSRGPGDMIHVALARGDQAPGLGAFLDKAGMDLKQVDAPEGVPQHLPKGMDAFVVLPVDFGEKLASGHTADIRLYVDNTTKGGAKRGGKVERAIKAYGGYVAGARLVTRGVPAELMTPVAVQTSDISTRQFVSKMLSYSMVLLLLMAPFVTGMSVALDSFAGERERKSLLSLMAQPVSARTVVLGKWLTVALFSFVGTSLTLTVNLVVLNLLPADVLPFGLKVTALGAVLAYFELATLSLFVAALLLVVSIRSKSFKEGQTYMSIFMLLPVLIGYMKMYGDAKLPAVANYLPIFADIESLSHILFVGGPDWRFLGAAMLSCVVLGAGALMLMTRHLSDEKLLADG